ncbi:MAG: DUF4886 domain-containing protein [Prevotella sp.]|nr:DUF4886 domain-containing protein [Prevotella sp.]
MKQFIIAMLVVAVQLGQPGLCGCGAAAQGLDTSINNVLTKPGLKILHIGHSFTFDAVCYLPDIVKGTGADISDLCIYRTMLGGASFRDWVDTYNDAYPWQDYQIAKVIGGIDASIATGTANGSDGSLLRQALTGEQWDIIFLQPSPLYSPYYELWAGNTYGGYLNELLAILKKQQPQATIGLMLLHSYASDYMDNAEHSSLERWKLIAQSVEHCCADYGIDLVLPYGTAVQNMRASSLNNAEDLTCDGAHCEFLLTRYAASCCYYQTIIAPRTGIPVTEDKTLLLKEWMTVASPMISVDDNTRPIAHKAAMLAVEDPYHCTNPETGIVVGIDATLNDKGEMINEKCFDLQGRKIENSKSVNSKYRKGVYIKDGRKYVR